MYKNEPSSSGGINSLPSPGKLCAIATSGRVRKIGSGIQPKRRGNPSQINIPNTRKNAGTLKNDFLCLSAHRKMDSYFFRKNQIPPKIPPINPPTNSKFRKIEMCFPSGNQWRVSKTATSKTTPQIAYFLKNSTILPF